ncbi:MAG TPA: hypothetical protein DCK78_05365 [Paenibacillus lactis]|nr:hypothetical protein [Paenibacillus lactis]
MCGIRGEDRPLGIYFKKDILLFWRDRKEVLVALLLPIALTLILGFALPGWVNNSNPSLEMKVALVNQNRHTEGVARFHEQLKGSLLSPDEQDGLVEETAMLDLDPEAMLMGMFRSEDVSRYIEVLQLDHETAYTKLKAGEVTAVITIPETYTLDSLNKLLLNEGDGAALLLTAEEDTTKVSVLQNMLNGLLSTVNYQAALSHAAGSGSDGSTWSAPRTPVGGLERIEGVRMITSFQYFAFAITIFVTLSISITMASKSITEKREKVFTRLLYSGARPMQFQLGKMASTFCIALLQMLVVILLSHVLFQLFPGRPLSFWLGLGIFMVLLCAVVAAFAGLFTAMVFRMKDGDVAVGISFIALILLGVIGGSMVPMYILPDWLMEVGRLTPNGLALTSLIQWIQGTPLQELWLPMLSLGIYTVIIMAAGLWMFPKKGGI